MLQQLNSKIIMLTIFGFIFLSLSPGNEQQEQAGTPAPQGVQPGVSEGKSRPIQSGNGRNGRNEVAQTNAPTNPYPRDGHFRMGDWDFRENWRYDRDAFYEGKTQAQAYREEHPYGPGGIGYDADINYTRNLRRLQELYQRHPTSHNKQRLEEYVNPYHVHAYHGNYGEGSYNDAYGTQNPDEYRFDQNER